MSDPSAQDDASETSLLLGDQLCFALHSAARAISRAYVEVLREEGMTYPQYLVLLCLFENDGQTVSEIGRLLALDSGTLTPIFKRLEAEGIVSRRRSSEDERKVEIWLTETGRARQALARRARRHVVEKLKMTDREIVRMRRELMDVAELLSVDVDKDQGP